MPTSGIGSADILAHRPQAGAASTRGFWHVRRTTFSHTRIRIAHGWPRLCHMCVRSSTASTTTHIHSGRHHLSSVTSGRTSGVDAGLSFLGIACWILLLRIVVDAGLSLLGIACWAGCGCWVDGSEYCTIIQWRDERGAGVGRRRRSRSNRTSRARVTSRRGGWTRGSIADPSCSKSGNPAARLHHPS